MDGFMSLPKLLIDLLNDPETPNCIFRDAIEDTLGKENMVKIYLIKRIPAGTSGGQADVTSFLDDEEANSLCEKLNAWCIENKVHSSQLPLPYSQVSVGTHSTFGSGVITVPHLSSSAVVSGSIASGQIGTFQFAGSSVSSGGVVSGVIHPGQFTPRPKLVCPFDPDFIEVAYFGVEYKVVSIPLRV